MKRIALVFGLLMALSGCGEGVTVPVKVGQFAKWLNSQRQVVRLIDPCTSTGTKIWKYEDGYVFVRGCGVTIGLRIDAVIGENGTFPPPSDFVASYNYDEDFRETNSLERKYRDQIRWRCEENPQLNGCGASLYGWEWLNELRREGFRCPSLPSSFKSEKSDGVLRECES